MATKMTINGVSTCQSAGTENYKPTLDECRAARDKWLTAKERKEEKR